jgi:predicted secreted protein
VGITTGVLVYVILWWLMFFMVLPWGVQPIENPEPGWQRGAPLKPKLWMKALVTTGLATAVLYLFVPIDMMQWAIFKEK